MTKVFVDFLSLSKKVQEQYLKLHQDRFHTISKIGISILHAKLLSDHCVTFGYKFNFKTAMKCLTLLRWICSYLYMGVKIKLISRK
jgi:hypothetical protein